MRAIQISQLIAKLKLDGFENQISIKDLKRQLVPFIGCDKYRLKYQIEALCECGYFEPISPSVLKINSNETE